MKRAAAAAAAAVGCGYLTLMVKTTIGLTATISK